jgi:hypothetical protein
MAAPTVLALDIAKNRTGWAVGSPGMSRPYWGCFEIAGPWDGSEGARLHEWRRFLIDNIAIYDVTYIAVERPFVDLKAFQFNGTVPILQMHGIAAELAHDKRIGMGEVSIQSWRCHFLGKATAPKHLADKERTPYLKDLARRRCAERGWLCERHDEAEALGIMDFALACLDADYDHKTGPLVRRNELKAEVAEFRGEAPT